MLLHGWGASGDLMLPIAKGLKGYACIIPDFYGFGRTAHPDYPLRLGDYVQGVLDILSELGVSRAVFLGHSFGGRVCIEISAHYPNMVKKLILCDSAGILPKRTLKYYIKTLFYRIRKLLGLSTEKCGSAEYRVLKGPIKKTFVNVVNYDQSPLLRKINAETLIIWGARDRVTPMYMAKKFKREIKNSQLCVLDKAGHFAYADDLKKFNEIVKNFLR